MTDHLITHPRSLAVGDQPTTVGPVIAPGLRGPQVLSLHRGLITAITPAPDDAQPSHLALPAFAEPHLHPDRAYVGSPRPPRSLDDAIELGSRPEGYVEETAAQRAKRLFTTLLANGGTRARGHVGCHPEPIAAPRWEVMGEVREELADVMEVELVAFAVADTLIDGPEVARLHRDLTLGRYQLIGGSPNHDSRPRESISAMMELAATTGMEVDVHIDETLDPARLLMDFALAEVERCDLGDGCRSATAACSARCPNTRPGPWPGAWPGWA